MRHLFFMNNINGGGRLGPSCRFWGLSDNAHGNVEPCEDVGNIHCLGNVYCVGNIYYVANIFHLLDCRDNQVLGIIYWMLDIEY